MAQQVVRAQFDYLVNGVAADLNRIARRAYAEGLITKPTLQNVTNPTTNETDRATSLVSAIQQKIGISHEAFSVFLKILREEPVVSELADTLEGGLRESEKKTAQKRPSRNSAVGKLGPRDLVDVLTELLDVCADWEDIGLGLGLTPGTLDAMKGPYKGHKDCLKDMLKKWLNTSPNPSWRSLIQALRRPIVGKEPLASHLETKYGT